MKPERYIQHPFFDCMHLRISIAIILLCASTACNQGRDTEKPHLNEFGFIHKLATLDKPLPPVQSGDWLAQHPENGQTFAEYLYIKPVSPNDSQSVIYLQPIGNFNADQDSIVRATADYLHVFFHLETRMLPAISDTLIPSAGRRTREDGSEQLHTRYILDSILQPNIPADAIVVMAVTTKDLYPKDSWNFVFGEAYTKKRTGVSSLHRYYENGRNNTLCLKRFVKTSSHEISHMFSLLHCTNAICSMNGTNNLPEADSKPNRLCSVCLSKLYWNLEFNNAERLSSLKGFFKKHGLESDYQLTDEDLKTLTKR
jgi:archaemetzincin